MNPVLLANIKKLRESLSYTQEQIAKAIGIDSRVYRRCETGFEEVPYSVLEKLSDFFVCDVNVLFDENLNPDVVLSTSTLQTEGLTKEDYTEVLHFKGIVRSYLKMVDLERN